MTTVSYAQNGEDVVLARVFPDKTGFYIDVGASDPVVDSVTKLFYDRGWHGINIEPAATALERLQEARPRDVNLGVAVGDSEATVTFYELPVEMTGCSTLSLELAEEYRREGWEPEVREVAMVTLTSLCEEQLGEEVIDFMKIDVEGNEQSVLAGVDLARFRPRVLVIESTRPGTPTATHGEWESLVLDAGYEFVLFDGLNRFYVRAEDAQLKELLAAPANPFDDYITYRYATLQGEVKDARREAHAAHAREQDANAREQSANAREQDANAREQDALRALEQTREQLAASQAALRDARTELSASREALTSALAARSDDQRFSAISGAERLNT